MDNTEVIYSCAMYFLNVKQFDLKDIFKHELSSVPLSLFNKSYDSRLAKWRVNFKSTLNEKVSLLTCLSFGWLCSSLKYSLT